MVKKWFDKNSFEQFCFPTLIESVSVEGKDAFLISYKTNSGSLILTTTDKIKVNDKVYLPISQQDCPYHSYNFNNEFLKKKIDFNQLYKRVFNEVERYVDIEEYWKHFITTCILFTYKQDSFSTTPYVFLVGDNDSGKSTILYLFKELGYRALLSESLPAADIFFFLGTEEEATGTILEDEAQGLEFQREKLKIYKGGYVKGSRIPRIRESATGIKQQFYYAFCFKVFAGEKLPDDTGFLRRCIVIPMIEGLPTANVKDLQPEDKRRLEELRNDLLLWRMQTSHDQLQEIKIDFLKNRDKELWKPLLQIVSSTEFFSNISDLALKHVKDRLKERADSLEAVLFKIVEEFSHTSQTILFDGIWNKILELPGQEDSKNTQVFWLDEHGKVTKTNIGKILTQKFKGTKTRIDNKRAYYFDKSTLERLSKKYSLYGLHGIHSLQESSDHHQTSLIMHETG